MKPESLPLNDFLELSGTIFDVRTPLEYSEGRIEGALNLPLFSNEERVIIGTAYKQESQEKAIELGMGFAGPKLTTYIRSVKEQLCEGYAKVHCWRGGMRSASMAWLLRTAGIPTVTLQGGYKTYRAHIVEQFSKPFRLKVIGGLTGSGKTAILHELKAQGEQVIDLESLANHRGSSFGNLGLPPQPSVEQFQNEIGYLLMKFNPDRPIWVEDESSMIGTCAIPKPFFDQMLSAPLFIIARPLDERLAILLKDYQGIPLQQMIQATERIGRKLGGEKTSQALDSLKKGNLIEAAETILHYYDKTYLYNLKRPATHLDAKNLSAQEAATMLKGSS